MNVISPTNANTRVKHPNACFAYAWEDASIPVARMRVAYGSQTCDRHWCLSIAPWYRRYFGIGLRAGQRLRLIDVAVQGTGDEPRHIPGSERRENDLLHIRSVRRIASSRDVKG